MDNKINLKVLVVDDEAVVRVVFRRLLSMLNLEMVEAENGYQAIELVKKNKFDLYFIDVRMPGINGLETYREIRKIDPNAVVIMITGYAVENILDDAKREGVNGTIHKPFDVNEVKELIEKSAKIKKDKAGNILVIDDEDVVLNFFAKFLQEMGLNYKIAHNKEEALAAAKKESFDLVFLDLVFNGVDGIEIHKEIKNILPNAKFVLITGYPQKAEDAKGKIDFTDCIYKPLEIKDVLENINRIKQNKLKN